MSDTASVKLAYVVSHPIQYQAPLLRRIAAEPDIDLTVYFCSDFSLRAYRDAGFGAEFKWDVNLLDGYKSVVLPRVRETTRPSPTRPISYGIFRHLLRGTPDGPFDAVWVHGYSTLNALHAISAAKALGLPVLLRAESWLGDRPRTGRTLSLKKAYLSALKPMLDCVLSIGTQNTRYWRHYFGEEFPIFTMPYAVDNDFFVKAAESAAPHREELRTEFNLEPGRPIILFASKLQKRKHCDHLLEAYLRMRGPNGEDPHPYFVIVGDGEERQNLEARVQESGCTSVRFAGFRNQKELARFLDLADVFVLPSRHEPWGLIVNEAMNANVAVIVTDEVGSAVDLIEDGVTGFIYPATNIDALYEKLQLALKDPETTCAIAERARQFIRTWGYEADIRGLRAALAHTTGKISAEPR